MGTHPEFSILTLGKHAIRGGSIRGDIGTLGFALIVYLAMTRREPTRSELCELLWEQDGPAERHRLRQLIYMIRQRTPGLLAERTPCVNHDCLRLDAVDCAYLAKSGDVDRAITMYVGHFLQTFPHISRPFTDWQDAIGAEIVETLRCAAHARLKTERVDSPEVVLLANWLREYDELVVHERVRLVGALVELGRRREANIELHQLESLPLSREAQVAADDLMQQLRRPEESLVNSVAFVLPDATRRQLSDRVTANFHQPLTILVGDAGVGKSRLLDWMARLAAVRGAKVYSHTILSTAPPSGSSNLHTLASLLHNTNSRGLGDDIPSLAGATADLIGKAWAFIAIDNVNRADAPTREFIRLLAAMSKSHSVMIVCAVAGDGGAEDTAWVDSLLPTAAIIRVESLDDHLAAALLDRLALANGYAFTESQRSLIIDQSRGIPRRIVRMAEVIADGPEAGPITNKIEDLISRRVLTELTALSDLNLKILGCVAFSLGDLDKVSLRVILGLSASNVDESLGHLEMLSLIVVDGVRISAIGPHILTALWAVADSETQREIRLHLAAYYSGVGNHLAAAEYYDGAGDRRTSGLQYELGAVKAMQVGHFGFVEKACKAALARSTTPEEYHTRSRLLASYYARVSRFEEAYPHLLSLLNRTPEEDLALLTGSMSFIESDSDSKWTEVAERLVDMHAHGVNQASVARAYLVAFDRAYQFGKEGVILPAFRQFLVDKTATDPRERAEVLMKSARINQLFGDSSIAPNDADEAVKQASAANDPVILANAYDTRALVSFLSGRVDSALADFEASETIAESASLYFLRERYYNNLAVLHYEIGNLSDARRLLRTAALFNPHTQLYALSNLAVVELAAGNFELARSYGLKLRSNASATYSVIGLTVCGISELNSGGIAAAHHLFWEIYRRTSGFRLQITDPSYTLSFMVECGSVVGVDPVPYLEHAAEKLLKRNIYSYLRVRMALARALVAREPVRAKEICESTLHTAKHARAIATHAQAEALLATF